MESRIRSLRDGLVQARRQKSLRLLDEVVRGVHDLAGEKYRCCLLDYNSFSTAFYVRVLGFENARVKAELEFPIEPTVSVIQWLPLSHLADYEEVGAGEEKIRRIYDDVSPYVRRRTADLEEESPNLYDTPVFEGNIVGIGNGLSPARRRARRRRSVSTALWWCAALVLMAVSVAALLSA